MEIQLTKKLLLLIFMIFFVSICPITPMFAKISPFANKKIEKIDTISCKNNIIKMYQLVQNQWYKVEYNIKTKKEYVKALSDKFAKTYPYKNHIDSVLVNWKNTELTKENIIKLAIRLDIDRIDIFFQQIMVESGYLKSNACLKRNNLKGMRFANQRFTYALGEKFGYAVYESWIYSIADYKIWQLQNPWNRKETYGQYLDKRGYAKSNTYGKRIEFIAKETFKPYQQLYCNEKKQYEFEKLNSLYQQFYNEYFSFLFYYQVIRKPFYLT